MLHFLVVALFITSAFAAEEEPLVRVAHYEPVINFQADLENGELSFMAYRKLWQINIWLTEVHDGNTDHFHGRLKDDDKSYCSFSLLPNAITGMIILHNDTFWLEHKHRSGDPALYMYRSSDVWLHPSMDFKCQAGAPKADDHDHSVSARDLEVRDHAHADGPPSVNVWVDQYWANANINPWFSTASTIGLLNDVNAIYAAVGLHIFAYTQVGQRNNGWTQNSQLTNMLNDFSAFAAVGNLGSTTDIGFWLCGNNIGGLAWIGTGCSTRFNPYYRTGLAGLAATSRLWTIKTIAHELGHLRGAQHYTTNQCAPNQSTNCQCSVMSFCFPTANTAGGETNSFAPVSVAQIQRSCP